jgi:chloramphenicol-sensitive protein RarD
MLLPISTLYLVWLSGRGSLTFGHDSIGTDLLLLGAGAVTALPLLWFTHAARRLTLSTVGLMQYLAPSVQLLIGVVVYTEPFTRGHAASFALIWTGLALYSCNSVRAQRQANRGA